MKYYIELTLLPDMETPVYYLWEKVYQQLHLALVEQLENDKSKVGVSFPRYSENRKTLSNKLRLFALSETDLQALNLKMYFARLEDYVHKTSIKEIPEDKIKGYAFFKREQVKSNVERLAKRRASNLKISYEEALSFFLNEKNRKQPDKTRTEAPFIYLYSQTRKQRFPLFIDIEGTEQKPEKAEFSSYGLSTTCSVPLF